MRKRQIKQWTIIMQVSAENNLFPDMLRVMEELYDFPGGKSGEFTDINFLVLFDGLSVKRFSYEFARPSVYLVRPGTSFYVEYPLLPLRKDDMTNPATLEKVLGRIKKNFPAKKYGFIYKGHGSHGEGDIGSMVFKERIMKFPVSLVRGKNADEKLEAEFERKAKYFSGWKKIDHYPIQSFNSLNVKEVYMMVILGRRGGKNLTYRVMAEVLKKVFGPGNLDFVFLDCCWGMQIENAYSFREAGKYFIASADLMPAAGVGYNDLLRKLTERPAITGREMANLLLSVFFTNKYDDYDNEDDPSFRKMGVSLTNLKTDELNEFLRVFDEFCQYLMSDMPRFSALIKKVRSHCDDYTYSERVFDFNMYNIDLVWFLENMVHFNNRFTRDEALEKCCLKLLYILTVRLRYGFMGNNYKKFKPGTKAIGGNGITITFPENSAQFRKSMFYKSKSVKPAFVSDTKWDSFLNMYYSYVRKVTRNKKTLEAYRVRLEHEPALSRMIGLKKGPAASVRKTINRYFQSDVE